VLGIFCNTLRKISKDLSAWKVAANRKPLILRGARQVGKTFSLKEFGAHEFKNCFYINFEEDERLLRIFETDLNPQRILNDLSFYRNLNIDTATDLLIFDEIQRCGRALTSLKYFCEEIPGLALCAAGSLLGVTLSVVRKIQFDLFETYLAEIAKHSGKAKALTIERLWRNVPEQLARVINGAAPKFRFKDAVSGIRGYERIAGSIDWLECANLIIRTAIAETAAIPFSAYAPENCFKLYMFDVGMLGAISDIAPGVLIQYGFGSYQGYVAENFIAQELKAAGFEELYCWQGRTSEIEFILSSGKGIVPLEVKSGLVTNSKSLSVFQGRFHPVRSYILSGRNSEVRGNHHLVPLYSIETVAGMVKEM
jgi:predicted AAA+ superfamily ATPase